MSKSHLQAGIVRVYLTAALLAGTFCCFLPALADQKTNQEPVRTTLPAGPSTHASKFMMAPMMTADERNSLYLQWGLAFAAGLTVVSGLVIWIFLNTRKEAAEEEGQAEDNAYSVATAPDSPPDTPAATKSDSLEAATVTAAATEPTAVVESASGSDKADAS